LATHVVRVPFKFISSRLHRSSEDASPMVGTYASSLCDSDDNERCPLMSKSRTRLAVVACAECGTVVSTAASSVVMASAATPLKTAAVTFTAPSASLDNPRGIASAKGTIDVSNTADNVVSSIVGTATTTVAGSYEGIGETGDGGPSTGPAPDRRLSGQERAGRGAGR
jgi:hypothetical protein